MIEIVLRILIYGAVLSGIWALTASGFSLIFGIARILNFAHGTFFVLSAYLSILLIKNLGFNIFISYAVSVILVGLVGVVIYKIMMAPIREHEVMVIIVTLAFALLVGEVLLLIFGEHGISVPSFARGFVEIAGVPITWKRISVFIAAIVVIILLEYFINRTRTGKMISAASQNLEAAMIVGMDVERLFVITMFISAALAAFGGLLYAQVFAASPIFAFKSLIFAFAIVILGGLGSVRGSIIASFIVGYILTITINTLGARWGEFMVLVTIIGILIVRPTGLFGVEE
ncbi:branched-chain amino acid ABC transporter permease [Archaeoglobales archaeon]|nr:MAG: branched-chain amino acid ABC transporter permease [Archaeoglobales archaeon]